MSLVSHQRSCEVSFNILIALLRTLMVCDGQPVRDHGPYLIICDDKDECCIVGQSKQKVNGTCKVNMSSELTIQTGLKSLLDRLSLK